MIYINILKKQTFMDSLLSETQSQTGSRSTEVNNTYADLENKMQEYANRAHVTSNKLNQMISEDC